MTSHPFASIGTAKSRLRNRIVSAQRIITVAPASPSANTHVTMAAYNGACEHLRSDILRARKLFPDTNALLTGPQHGVADDAFGGKIASAWPLLSERRRKKPKNGGGHPDRSEAGIPNLQEPHTCQMY